MTDRVEPRDLDRAVTALHKGHVVALQTDTVFGLAVDPENTEAVNLLRRMKDREADRPIAVLVADERQAADVAGSWPWHVYALADAYWPGPLTVVVPVAEPGMLRPVQSEQGTVGLRHPDHAVVVEIIRRFGRPVAATSANTAGTAPLQSSQDVMTAFSRWADQLYVISQDSESPGIASTVIDLASRWQIEPREYRDLVSGSGDGGWPTVLREGAIDREMVRSTLCRAAR
ncbi:MAG: Sua5/YciO/YrdC/YwlC family protein [Planctomycetes bacterium]|nr:Sua5/YciO/YrdC/YwlC family protein [Planctomycetota bacterium]NOG53851.1 L-threonylcarbamoyladenylate synthase [Planctomycetota bacterium]